MLRDESFIRRSAPVDAGLESGGTGVGQARSKTGELETVLSAVNEGQKVIFKVKELQ